MYSCVQMTGNIANKILCVNECIAVYAGNMAIELCVCRTQYTCAHKRSMCVCVCRWLGI